MCPSARARVLICEEEVRPLQINWEMHLAILLLLYFPTGHSFGEKKRKKENLSELFIERVLKWWKKYAGEAENIV